MIHIGYTESREHVTLDKQDLATHVHGTGLTQTGKSRLIEYIARELIKTRKGFCLIDPHGTLYRDFLAWLSFIDPRQKVIPFDTSEGSIGYNPFTTTATGPREIRTKTDQMVKATLRVWGSKNEADYPRLRDLLTHIYYLLIEQQLPVSSMRYFLRHSSPERDAIIDATTNDDVRYWLEEKYAMPRREFANYIESVEHRFALFSHEQVETIMAGKGIDLPTIIEKQQVLVCNFQPVRLVISREATRIIGSFLINDIIDYFSGSRNKKEFYVIVDECDRYLSPDIEESVAESAKYGLHFFLFHHQEDQGGKDIERMLRNARVKVRFYSQTNQRFQLERPNKKTIDVKSPEVKTAPHYRVDQYIKRLTVKCLPSKRSTAPISVTAPVPELDFPLMDLPTLTYSQDPGELLAAFKYLTASQLETLTGRSNQAVRKALLSVNCVKKVLDGKNVYCWPEKGKRHKHLRHELGITDFHLALYRAGILRQWEQSELKDSLINPDAYFVTDSPFFLEVENANPAYAGGESDWLQKARQYQNYYDTRRHRGRGVENFRVLFLMPTPAKAYNLMTAIRQSGIPNLGRFWVVDRSCIDRITEPVFRSPKSDQLLTIGNTAGPG